MIYVQGEKITINECLEKLENMINYCQETMQEEELTLLYERLHITIEEAKENERSHITIKAIL